MFRYCYHDEKNSDYLAFVLWATFTDFGTVQADQNGKGTTE